MQIHSNLSIFVVTFLSIFLIGCSTLNEEPQLTTIRGIAIDAISKAPFDSLLVSLTNEQCFFSDLGYCEPVNNSLYTNSQGEFYMTILQNCPSEMQVRIPNGFSKNYEHTHMEYYTLQGANFEWSCNDRPLFSSNASYNLEIQIHPTIQLNIERQDYESLDFKALKIPEFDIEISHFDYYLQSHVLKLLQYTGTLEVVIEFLDGNESIYEVEYDYFQQQIYELKVNI